MTTYLLEDHRPWWKRAFGFGKTRLAVHQAKTATATATRKATAAAKAKALHVKRETGREWRAWKRMWWGVKHLTIAIGCAWFYLNTYIWPVEEAERLANAAKAAKTEITLSEGAYGCKGKFCPTVDELTLIKLLEDDAYFGSHIKQNFTWYDFLPRKDKRSVFIPGGITPKNATKGMGVIVRGGFNLCRPRAVLEKTFANAGIAPERATPVLDAFANRCGVDSLTAYAAAPNSVKYLLTAEDASRLTMLHLAESKRQISARAAQTGVVLTPLLQATLLSINHMCEACVVGGDRLWVGLRRAQTAENGQTEVNAIASTVRLAWDDWKWSKDPYNHKRAVLSGYLLAAGMGMEGYHLDTITPIMPPRKKGVTESALKMAEVLTQSFRLAGDNHYTRFGAIPQAPNPVAAAQAVEKATQDAKNPPPPAKPEPEEPLVSQKNTDGLPEIY